MALLLTRFAYAPFGTYGVLQVGPTRLYTAEQPWRLNERMRSCVPEGTYKIVNHHSRKYPNSYALVNHQLGVFHQPHKDAPPTARIAILIHAGNTPNDVSGCIAPGIGLGMLQGMWSVTNSRSAMDVIRRHIATTGDDTIIIGGVDLSKSVDEIPYA